MAIDTVAILTLILFRILIASTQGSSAFNSRGNRFIVTFPDGWDTRDNSFFITTSSLEAVTVNVTAPKAYPGRILVEGTVVRGQILSLLISNVEDLYQFTAPVRDLSVEVTSTADIFLYSANNNQVATSNVEASLHIPVNSMGNTYAIIQVYSGSISNSRGYSFIAIAAGEQPANINLTAGVNAVRCGLTINAGATKLFALDAYQTLYCFKPSDFTGANIAADVPVAVFSGIEYSAVAVDGPGNHLVEQLMPDQKLGKVFAVVPSPSTQAGDILRILAINDSTEIVFTPGGSKGVFNKGEFFQVQITPQEYIIVDATKPVSVMRFPVSPEPNNEPPFTTRPFMATVLPLNLYGNDFHLPAHRVNPTLQHSFILTIIIHSSLKDGLLLNGAAISATWTNLPKYNLVTAYITVTEGVQQILHSNRNVNFFAALTVIADHAYSYELLGGSSDRCVTSPVTDGDLIDNDCDGRIDEEIRDGIDDDGDGLIDEDNNRILCADEKTVCERNSVIVQCPTGTVQIMKGFYGRNDTVTCTGDHTSEWLANTSCEEDSNIVLASLKARCAGKTRCKLYSGNEYIDGDKCYATYKYLKFCHTCV